MKLLSKIFIKGKIRLLTGMHIGGSKTALDIGGIDLNVIKTAEGVPFIPGSSIKGKLRSLLAREEGSEKIENDSEDVKQIFGEPPSKDKTGQITRIIVRDALLDPDNKNKIKNHEDEFSDLELDYTETKWENTIDRKSGTAQNPRQLERVPAGVIFKFELVYNEFDDNKTDTHINLIKKALRLLEDDYLGGSGSRGYGKIKFDEVTFEQKTIEIYEETNQPIQLNKYEF